MALQCRSTYILAVLLVTLSTACSKHAEQSASQKSIPGTHIKLAIPDSYDIAPLGPYLISTDLTTTITVMQGAVSADPTGREMHKALFPHLPEAVKAENFEGRLYKRTKAEDGGTWDGWFLNWRSQDTATSILVSYTGTSMEEFESFRKILLSASVADGMASPEESFGATAVVPGLKLVKSGIGSLYFTESGQPETTPRRLMFEAIPVSKDQAKSLDLEKCQLALSASFQGEPFTGPNSISIDGQPGCDAWSINGEHYAAIVALSGTLVQAIGSGNPDDLRQGVLSLKSIR